ncbi:phenylacetate--CoA ligase family protein [Agromyces atrinae]|uniref:Phenylacetate--CoA ligase family protein n=1 Tax=Agromyces atrinae TaxID=592376 RepID=A0A4Q2M005_9MICO|nr:phenylacetate--CoA ligase family protein [Agromyces atrinae]NYD68407.1 phenylacetate-CoA ligase [Agromyces atrinae]RXZ85154.1 phenylacetate--CoA ligase family protein [Agromyces atrinae]
MVLKRIAFEVKTRLGARSSLALEREFRRNDHLDPAELESLRASRAIAHARFAMQNSPFYRDFYGDAGFSLDDLRDPAAFTALPLLDKETVRANFDTIRTPEATPESSAQSATGGSTGQPLRILRDLRFPARAIEWRLFRWWGIDPWDNRANVYRHVLVGDARVKHDRQWWPSKRLHLDAFSMTDDAVRTFVDEWNRARPTLLFAYVGAALELARALGRLGLAMHPPRAIAVTAAPLPESQRLEIEAGLGAPVYDHYRASEMPWLAGECAEQHGLHLFSDVRTVEVLDDDGHPVEAGTTGEVVATDMTNRVFPLIRYRMGDRTTPINGRCACGVTLPRIAPVSGRLVEALRLPGGGVVAGEALAQLFSKTPRAVRQFQLVQAADYSVIVRAIPGDDPDALAIIERAARLVHDNAAGAVPVRHEVVDTIPHVGGKTRFIISEAPV